MPFVYVGMTGIDPDVRFDKHKAGIQSNRYAREFGLRLLPQPLRTVITRCPNEGAREMGSGIGNRLAGSGYGVWQA